MAILFSIYSRSVSLAINGGWVGFSDELKDKHISKWACFFAWQIEGGCEAYIPLHAQLLWQMGFLYHELLSIVHWGCFVTL